MSNNLSTGFVSAPTVTRPANTTAYTAGDVVGGAIEFSGIPSQTDIILTYAALAYYVSALPSGMTSVFLHLYNATPPSAYADNAAWDLPAGDRAAYQGAIELATLSDRGATLHSQRDDIALQVRTGRYGLFGYLVTTAGFTPAGNSEVLVPSLRGVRA